ncbi:hypothetical protein B0675_02165 [Streptomyces sp. M41(2017)]|uniref:hypothetical protein n=1 Tax=Streptomyces sp. M41(2017) TaxID=1955065 RepID=UPI0009BF5DFF|nr:hypothetical protein [Streptomyces sp. M41(2017)]OQQ16112.1 hypothetical protein B0675_02165 [Streptomyces sp. M41(2017)]
MTRAQWQVTRLVASASSATATAVSMLWLREQGELGRSLVALFGLVACVTFVVWFVRRRRGAA